MFIKYFRIFIFCAKKPRHKCIGGYLYLTFFGRYILFNVKFKKPFGVNGFCHM